MYLAYSGLGQVTKFNPKMQNSKRALDLTWSKGRNLFNWLSNLKNFLLSNGSENEQNAIQMTLKKLLFSKKFKKSPSGWGICPQVQSVVHLSCTNLLAMSPIFDIPICKTFELAFLVFLL